METSDERILNMYKGLRKYQQFIIYRNARRAGLTKSARSVELQTEKQRGRQSEFERVRACAIFATKQKNIYKR